MEAFAIIGFILADIFLFGWLASNGAKRYGTKLEDERIHNTTQYVLDWQDKYRSETSITFKRTELGPKLDEYFGDDPRWLQYKGRSGHHYDALEFLYFATKGKLPRLFSIENYGADLSLCHLEGRRKEDFPNIEVYRELLEEEYRKHGLPDYKLVTGTLEERKELLQQHGLHVY